MLIELNDEEYKELRELLMHDILPSRGNYPNARSAMMKIINADKLSLNQLKEYMICGLATVMNECARIASEHGFWDNKDNPDRLCMLIVGEVAEAHEELRSGRNPDELYYEETEIGKKPCGVGAELADVLIRVFDHAAQMGINDLPAITVEKMQYNEKRPYKHGRQF